MKIEKLFYLFSILAITFYFLSCQSDKAKETKVEQLETIAADKSIPDYARYGLKSGVIEMVSSTMGMKQYITIYFDDYGKLITNEIKMNAFGMDTHLKTIMKDDYIYSFDVNKKVGTKGKIDSSGHQNINYLTLDKSEMEKFNIKYVGESEVLGKKCKDYIITMPEQNVEATASIWKGIALKSVAKAMGMTMKIEATNIQENVKIPEEIFEIPDDIIFEEMQEIIDDYSTQVAK